VAEGQIDGLALILDRKQITGATIILHHAMDGF
jgi:hypothetical protein